MSDHVDGVKRFLKGDESGHLVTFCIIKTKSELLSRSLTSRFFTTFCHLQTPLLVDIEEEVPTYTTIYLGSDGLSRLSIPPLRSVSDVRSNGGWSILPACTNKQLLPHAHLTTIDVSSDSDMTQWKYTANMLKHAFSKLGKEQYMLYGRS
ncbi:hypothetical protein F2Q69_00047888 [Brassica cretica]|uniref:Uncharacterized protein n=1 Tax=Brassica cretica TaxID=69181 RepID=A0A8S9PWN6_BRACR|nr:hypothetical protein F2Q69_00047888 [Brassica cretica]